MDIAQFSYCPSLHELLSTGRAEGATGKRFTELGAISTQNNLKLLRHIIQRERISQTLEIGLAFGASALAILSTLRENHGDRLFNHTAIDPFQSTVWDGVAMEMIKRESFLQQFQLYEDYSAVILPQLIAIKKRFDLIYIDGSHLFEDVFLDFYYCCDLLNLNGLLVFDDCTDKHVAKVISFIQRNYSATLRETDLNEFVKPVPLRKRIASLLGYRQARGFRKISIEKRAWNAPFVSF